MRLLLTRSVFLVVLCAPATSLGTTWHVPSKCPTIQAGIDSASTGDTVVVACGTYYERAIAMKSGICLRSEAGEPDCVTVDANGGPVLSCVDVDSAATVQGITITGGSGDLGGGMWCYRSAVRIFSCIFAQNQANHGGGIFCLDSSPTISGSVFIGNYAELGQGGMYCERSSLTLVGCQFLDNGPSGMSCFSSSVMLVDCIFVDNWAFHAAGAIGCVGSSMELTNCTMRGNLSFQYAGGIDCGSGSTVVLENTIIAFSPRGQAVLCFDAISSISLSCCDIYGNVGGDWTGCIADQYGINGNISMDPLFCDPDNDDFQIDAVSPCAPGNHPGYACGLIGAFDVGCDTSSTERETWGRLKAMYREREEE